MLFPFFSFSSNADIADALIFGKNIETWLIYTLVLLGLMLISYLAIWGIGLIRDKKSGKVIKQPWD